ncbi:MAG: hypothetical protein IJF98_01275, partial [Firmicutes bacterium]|nr:hypothetical protein [Bacillota bacterium]
KADFDNNYSLFISEAASLFTAPTAHLSLDPGSKYEKVIGYTSAFHFRNYMRLFDITGAWRRQISLSKGQFSSLEEGI